MNYPTPDHDTEQHHIREYGLNNGGGCIGLSSERMDRENHYKRLVESMTADELEQFNNIKKRLYDNDDF